MGRDKAKDDKFFNCSQPYEVNYVVELYPNDRRSEVREFIGKKCKAGVIKYFTHAQVYALIAKELGLPIPA